MPNPPARFKDLCLDAESPALLGRFWAQVLDRAWDGTDDGGRLMGAGPSHTIWINRVPETRQVKNRVHLDLYAVALTDLLELGARIERPQGDDRHWTVMRDPEGVRYCAFLRAQLPAERLHGLVVDSVDHQAIATWWSRVLGGDLTHDESGYSTISHVPGMPIETFDFVPVPEPKSQKNRIHWDVTGNWRDLVDLGATMLRPRDSEIEWDVLSDPEGNEFCVFA